MRRLFYLLLPAVAALAQPTYYQFSINEDALEGAADFSFLNQPLTAADRIVVRGGHFYRVGADTKPDTADDECVRFFGTNTAFTAGTPTAQDAPRIARRLRRLGINLVRLHWMDYNFGAADSDAEGLLTQSAAYPNLNMVSVGRLRGWTTALSAEGIYVNLNIHVGYTFRPALDGVPALANFPDMSKPLNNYYPRMVELQKEYARRLIGALALKDDPALAMVEINNEGSLLDGYQSDWSSYEPYIVGAYKDELQLQWNGWLKQKYSNTESLRQAWGASQPDGPEQLANNWALELHPPANATMSQSGGTITVRVTNGSNWVIVKNTGFTVHNGQRYIAEVELRADLPASQSRNVDWGIVRDVSPWDSQIYTTVNVTRDWQKFRLVLSAKSDMIEVGRFHLGVENVEAPLYIRNWSLRPAGARGLDAGETFDAGNISIVGRTEPASSQREADWVTFLSDTDRRFFDGMRDVIQLATDSRMPVTGTQVGYGGLMNFDSHRAMEFIDNHFYIDHYNFPNEAWDGQDWHQTNASGAAEGLWTVSSMALTRQAGKPFTVSEFNQPWPNPYGAEILPETAAYGAFQDWDAVLEYNYRQDREWDVGTMNAFNRSADWTKFAVAGQSAWLFRSGAVSTGRHPINVPVTAAQRLDSTRRRYDGDVSRYLADMVAFDANLALVQRVQLAIDGADTSIPEGPPSGPLVTDTRELTYDRERKTVLLHSPLAAGVIGFVNRDAATAGPLEVTLGAASRGFATILLTSRDGKPLNVSERLLLTTPGQSLRSMPGSNPPRPQKQVNYRGSDQTFTLEVEPGSTKPSGDIWKGPGPTWMERVEGFVTFRTFARSIQVFPLDGAGKRIPALASADVTQVEGGFRIHLQAEGSALTPWYEIVTSGSAGLTRHATVNGASFFSAGQGREAIVSSFGQGLAVREQSATSLPVPTNLAGTTVKVRDQAGAERLAPLFYVSPGQVNFQVPEGTTIGVAAITITAENGATASANVVIDDVGPGLFMANAAGAAAAGVTRVKADGTVLQESSSAPIDLGPAGDRVYLTLYATGVRHRSALAAARVDLNGTAVVPEYAGAQGGFAGLDQINVLLPGSLAGAGAVNIFAVVDGVASNSVTVQVK